MALESNRYQALAASSSAVALGGGVKGDYLTRLIVSVATAATGTCSITDGAGSAIPLTAANTPIGVYYLELQLRSQNGAWKVTTGAGATALAIGEF